MKSINCFILPLLLWMATPATPWAQKKASIRAEGKALAKSQKAKKSRRRKKTGRRKRRFIGEVSLSLNGIYDSLHRRQGGIGTNSDSVLVSNFQPQLILAWQLYWKKRWYALADIEFISRHYEAGNSQTILDREFHQGSVYGGVGYRWGQWSFANLYLGLDECFYYRQVDEEIYVLEDHRVPALKLRLSQKLLRLRKFRRWPLSFLGEFQYLNKSGLYFEGGLRYGVGMDVKYLMSSSSSLGTGVFYQRGVFDSVWSTFDYKALGFSLSYSKKF